MFSSGIGNSEGRNAFSASRSRQIESFPPENKQRWSLKVGGDFAHHVDGFRLEILEMVEIVAAHQTSRGSSGLPSPASRGKELPLDGLSTPCRVQTTLSLLVGLGRVEVVPLVRQIVLLEILLEVGIAPMENRTDLQGAEVGIQ